MITANPRHLLRRSAIVSALAIAPALSSCADDSNGVQAEVTKAGSITMALETRGESGDRFRLSRATFQISDVSTGETAAILNTDLEDPRASFLTQELDEGEYSVALMPGWRLERTTEAFPEPVPFPFPIPRELPPIPEPIAVPIPIAIPPGVPISVPIQPGLPVLSPVPAPFPGPFPAEREVVAARLISDAVQRVTIESNEESFLFYAFAVGDGVIGFGPGRLNIGIQVIEEEPEEPEEPTECDDPLAIERRALLDTTVGTTEAFSLREVFDTLANSEGFDGDGELIYQQIIDSYASTENARLETGGNCDEETTDGVPSLNGFPIECDRAEHLQFDLMDEFFATAIVNRIDLAPQNGAHCGQQRIVFASNALNRMFFIFEAQIPNPEPEAGLLGCLPIAQFWGSLTEIEDSRIRGEGLRRAFLTGLPELAELGFGPFMTASNLTVGTGQIRTNQFDSSPWTLREFKLATDGGLRAIRFPVAEAPNGQLWNDSIETPNGSECRDAFLRLVPELLSNNPAEWSFPVPDICKDAESRNNFSQAYAEQLASGNPEGFASQLQQALEGTGLSPADFAARAQFAGSCIGCHSEANGRSLGNGVIGPFASSFVHVSESGLQDCRDGECFRISNALQTVFLPHRRSVFESLVPLPVDPACDSPAAEPSPAPFPTVVPPFIIEPPFPTAPPAFPASIDSPVEPPQFAQPRVTTEPPALPTAPRAPAAPIALPAADTPLPELLEQEAEVRATYGSTTIGGQSARRTH